MIEIDPADERAIYVQIVDEIRRAVVLGVLKPEDPLPSVRQLAAELKVNPNTIKQAYRELERAGRTYVEPGRGTFISHWTGESPDEDRAELGRAVAKRAIRDAYRHGLTIDELIQEVLHAGKDEKEDRGVA